MDHVIRPIPEIPDSFYKFGRTSQKGISPSGSRKVFCIKKVLWLNKLITWPKLRTVKKIVSHYRRHNIFLLQSALQPLWVMACSTIVQYSQQEGFYRVLLPAARQTPNLEDQWLERSNSRHQVSLTSETTRANSSSGRWNYGREVAENFAESGDFHVTLSSFTCRKFTTRDRRLYFPSERRRAEDLNPRTWVPKASTLTPRPPKPLQKT